MPGKRPKFDRDKVKAATAENPFWIHFGAGNIFRAFQANVVQNLLNEGVLDRGLVVAEGFDYEIIEKMNRPHDDYGIAVTLKADGSIEKTVVGSVVESHILDSENEAEFGRLKEIFEKDSLQMASFTITEKGYSLVTGKGEAIPDVMSDFAAGPEKPKSYIGKVASLLYTRFQVGEKPVAMVSMDNCSHNGDKLYAAIQAFAEKWTENGLVDAGFQAYVNDKKKVSFPWSMIDKITMFTERETVDKVEKMKVCTCLNPLHTCLAVFGCILGYEKISEEMKDAELVKLVETVGYKEGLPVVINPGILDPKDFIDTVLKVRIPNPFMPDTPQRIATDTSQKLAIRFGETIKAYQASSELDVKDLKLIPLVFAGWLRYLMGINDAGGKFELSPDPLLDTVCPYVAGLKLGGTVDPEALRPVLENTKIFGVNLYDAGMAETVASYLGEMIQGPGAVRATLKKYV